MSEKTIEERLMETNLQLLKEKKDLQSLCDQQQATITELTEENKELRSDLNAEIQFGGGR